MCLGLVGRVIAVDLGRPDLARVDVGGAERAIHIGLIDEPVSAGDWVAIHLGLALQKLTDDEVSAWQDTVRMMGPDDGSGLDDPIPPVAPGLPAADR